MEKKIKRQKQRKGITLISLVLTIIVLLILVGITINLTIGQDGILRRAQEAGVEHEKAELKEELELAIFDIRTEKLSKGQSMTREDLIGLEKIGAIMESTGTPAEGEYKDYFFEVDENYVVTIIGKLKGEKPTVQAQVVTTGIVSQGGKVEIKVTASISEGNITEIVATNGALLKTNTSATEKVFEVSANGTYTFKVKADNGRTTSSNVEVNTILEAPQISIKDETNQGFTIVVNNNYAEGLITEYKYYVGGELKSSGTTNKEFIVTGLTGGEYTNIYVEAYMGDSALASNIASAHVKILATGISLNKYNLVIPVGTQETLIATILPENTTDKTITWTSSDENVATVSEGVVTAVANGTATIIATLRDGTGKSATCNVNIKNISTLNYSTKDMYKYELKSSSNQDATRTPDKIFDNSIDGENGCWHSTNRQQQWLQIGFDNKTKIIKFSIQNRNSSFNIEQFYLQASNDESNWVTLQTFINPAQESIKTEYEVTYDYKDDGYKYYRWYAPYEGYVVIGEMEIKFI